MPSYRSYKELSLEKKHGLDYIITVSDRASPLAVLAPHGGGIEPGTAEIALALAGEQHSCYIFDGLSEDGNDGLHLTSTYFDEPQCVRLVNGALTVLAVHGCAGKEEIVYVGGRHLELKHRLNQALMKAGFTSQLAVGEHAGSSLRNICNRCILGKGIQLEISSGLRRRMFKGLSRPERAVTTPVFDRFINTVQAIIDEMGVRQSAIT